MLSLIKDCYLVKDRLKVDLYLLCLKKSQWSTIYRFLSIKDFSQFLGQLRSIELLCKKSFLFELPFLPFHVQGSDKLSFYHLCSYLSSSLFLSFLLLSL